MNANTDWDSRRNDNMLSIRVASFSTQSLAASLAIITIFTHLAQLGGLAFHTYAWISFFLVAIVLVILGWNYKKSLTSIEIKDYEILFLIIGLSLIAGLISVTLRRVGRFIPDEYYYGANPVYYIQHSDHPMGFELFFFYSGGDPFYSVAYLTATAFDYGLGVISFITNIQFIKIYYVLGGGLGGFLIPLSTFLALSKFSKTTTAALLGTFFTTTCICLLAETVWTPGGYSLTRAFEGKVIMLFAGIPLFIYYSISYFMEQSRKTWAELFLVLTMLTGMSTSSFMIFPILAGILYASYWFSHRESFLSFIEVFKRGMFYFSTFAYLVLFAIFVSQKDKLDTALAINISNGYTDTIKEYLLGFYNSAIPLTPILLILFSIVMIFITRGKMRIFLATWMGLVLFIVPNPFIAKILLTIFRGIYFRLFYIYPFLLIVGVAISILYENTTRNKLAIWLTASALSIFLLFISSSSLFVSDRYAWGSWSTYKENAAALEIVAAAPHGLMIAPYPISGAISMIDSGYPQLITRDDHTLVYLGQQGRMDEALLRTKTSDFFDNAKIEDLSNLEKLIQMYPELKSIVFNRKIFYREDYTSIRKKIVDLMQEADFVHRKDLASSVIFWR